MKILTVQKFVFRLFNEEFPALDSGSIHHMPTNSMKKTIITLFFIIIGFQVLQAADKISILLVDGQNNHNWKATTPVLKAGLEETGRFTVDVSTTPAKGVKDGWEEWNPEFSKYDAVLSNYNGQLWPEKAQKGLEKYVSEGGGLIIVHAANNSFSDWHEYNRMIGVGGWGGRTEKHGPYIRLRYGKFIMDHAQGRGGSHGPQHEFVVTTRNTEHPITKGLPTTWLHCKDELYDSLRGPAENVTVLATAFSPKSNEHEPIIMTIDYGKGRVFHTPMGHADYSMKCVGFLTYLARGSEWAATGKVTFETPKDFPTEEKILPHDPTAK